MPQVQIYLINFELFCNALYKKMMFLRDQKITSMNVKGCKCYS